MNPADRSDCREASRADHAASCLLTDLFGRDLIDQRAPLSVQGHHHCSKSIAPRSFEDQDFDDETLIGPYEVHGPSRKSDAELNRVLAILDNIKNGKEITR